jgi:molecular chaperone IbpA
LLNYKEKKAMNNLTPELRFDLNQLHRTTVGFDRLFDEILGRYQNSTTTSAGYPPYNVEKIDENQWRVIIAVAGFGENDIEVTVENGNLSIVGRKEDKADSNMVYQGIANRQFSRSFQLADYVEVENATLKDGLLTLDLVRHVPEALKPKKIKLNTK